MLCSMSAFMASTSGLIANSCEGKKEDGAPEGAPLMRVRLGRQYSPLKSSAGSCRVGGGGEVGWVVCPGVAPAASASRWMTSL